MERHAVSWVGYPTPVGVNSLEGQALWEQHLPALLHDYYATLRSVFGPERGSFGRQFASPPCSGKSDDRRGPGVQGKRSYSNRVPAWVRRSGNWRSSGTDAVSLGSQGESENSPETGARAGGGVSVSVNGFGGSGRNESLVGVSAGQGHAGAKRTKRGKRGSGKNRVVKSEKGMGTLQSPALGSVRAAERGGARVALCKADGVLVKKERVLRPGAGSPFGVFLAPSTGLKCFELEENFDFVALYNGWIGYLAQGWKGVLCSSELQVLAKYMVCRFVKEHSLRVNAAKLIEFVG